MWLPFSVKEAFQKSNKFPKQMSETALSLPSCIVPPSHPPRARTHAELSFHGLNLFYIERAWQNPLAEMMPAPSARDNTDNVSRLSQGGGACIVWGRARESLGERWPKQRRWEAGGHNMTQGCGKRRGGVGGGGGRPGGVQPFVGSSLGEPEKGEFEWVFGGCGLDAMG